MKMHQFGKVWSPRRKEYVCISADGGEATSRRYANINMIPKVRINTERHYIIANRKGYLNH